MDNFKNGHLKMYDAAREDRQQFLRGNRKTRAYDKFVARFCANNQQFLGERTLEVAMHEYRIRCRLGFVRYALRGLMVSQKRRHGASQVLRTNLA